MNRNFAVIFDMDGVIVNNFHYHEKAWKRFCEIHHLGFYESFRSQVFGTTNKFHLEALFGRELSDKEIERYEREKEKIYRDLYRNKIEPVKGLLPFLENLSENQVPIALATSSPPVNVNFVLDHTKIKKYFSVILNAVDVKKGKPDPEIYLKASELLNIPPEKCIVIEDSVKGIESARQAGMKVIGMATTHKAVKLQYVNLLIFDFEELNIRKLMNLM